ncbi:MAG: helix-turn-helix domain-containing protein [Bacteroidales bacterium]|nr:helix-turn-helix domain-containing protein [Bacteroidales bacterium]
MFSDKSLILNRLKFALKCKTNADLAKQLGIAPNTLTNWYKRNTLDYDLIFSKCVHLSVDWLLTGTGSMLRNAVATDATHSIDMQCNVCKQKDKRIEELHYIIDVQRELIQELKEKGEEDRDAPNASCADVG